MGKYADITKMTVDERLQQIADMTQMSESDIEILKKKNALSLETADSYWYLCFANRCSQRFCD